MTKLNDESLNWIYQHLDELEQKLIVCDFARAHRRAYPQPCSFVEDRLHDLIFSFLMVMMGENIPKTLWSVTDYSVLYGLIDENRDLDGIELTDSQ